MEEPDLAVAMSTESTYRDIVTVGELRQLLKTADRVFVSAGGLGYVRVSKAEVQHAVADRVKRGVIDPTVEYINGIGTITTHRGERCEFIFLRGDW